MSAVTMWARAIVLSAIASASITAPVQAQTTVRFVHTDALGSVVAVTDESRAVVERREYEPYGKQLTALRDGPGYTGHVQDSATGMTYMQQRYYDPELGLFLSVDPIVAHRGTGKNFNRYRYGNDNPYRYMDPDGRQPVAGTRIVGRWSSASVEVHDYRIEDANSPGGRLKAADAHIKKVQKRLESTGNRFKSSDDAARYFRDNFADKGTELQLEFGANSEPGTNAIVDITRSPFIDQNGVGSTVNIMPGMIGGSTFHTHPDLSHPNPGFSWSDIVSSKGGPADYEYVFYGGPNPFGRKMDIRGTEEVSGDEIFYDQDTHAPEFR